MGTTVKLNAGQYDQELQDHYWSIYVSTCIWLVRRLIDALSSFWRQMLVGQVLLASRLLSPGPFQTEGHKRPYLAK